MSRASTRGRGNFIGLQPSGGPLDADDLRLVGEDAVLRDLLDRVADGKLRGLVRDENDRLQVYVVAVLDDGLERDLVVGHALGDGSEHPEAVVHRETDEVATLVRAHPRP